MDGYRFFRKDKPGWRNGELPLKMKEWECFPLGWLMSPVERICVKIKGFNYIVADVCCKHPDKEEADESFFQQLELASSLQALILNRGLTDPNICWKGNTAW